MTMPDTEDYIVFDRTGTPHVVVAIKTEISGYCRWDGNRRRKKMLLSEMFGVERDVDFKVKGYESLFKVTLNVWQVECLMFKLPCVSAWELVSQGTLCDVIFAAPSGIIHLPPLLTDEQREQLKAIWTLGGRWLAKDENGKLLVYAQKPEKNDYYGWWAAADCFSLFADIEVSNLVSWSDPEPYDIGKALEVEG